MSGEKLIANNKRARRDYRVIDTYEAGVALQGTEVKSLRTKGNFQLKDSYASVEEGQIYLVNTHITPYDQGNINNHEPERKRKLLMHKQEINRLARQVAEKGLTLVPLRVYFKRGKVKVEVGVCQGKAKADKREDIKKKESQREMERALKHARRGGS